MALDLTIFAADLAEIIADLPSTVTWKGTVYSWLVGDQTRGRSLQDEGFMGDWDCQVVAPASDFSVQRPSSGDLITIGGEVYRIKNVITGPDGAGITMNCEAKTQ